MSLTCVGNLFGNQAVPAPGPWEGEGPRALITRTEGNKLAELARDGVVLEIGSYEGGGTIFLASTAKRVHTVDWHYGDVGVGEVDTLAKFFENINKAGIRPIVAAHVGNFVDVLPRLATASFDLVFVDGDHYRASVRRDLAQALRLVKPDGIIALHDYHYPSVRVAVRDVLGECEPDGTCESLAWFKISGTTSAKPTQAKVFLALPTYNGNVHIGGLPGLTNPTILRPATCAIFPFGGSLLAHVFNALWCQALNKRDTERWTHFAMMHSDIEVGPGWLEILLDELDRTDADVMSCVIALKDMRGLTTTALRIPGGNLRRLTMSEVMNLPETFDAAGAGARNDEYLAVNTGLWVCRFDEPWVVEFPGFSIRDEIHRHEDGQYRPHVLSEDWGFSEWCHEKGLNVMATRKVRILHHGDATYPNDAPWGTHKVDSGD